MTSPIFSTQYKIYINHTDAGGIVYHANHLTFFENCRRDWFTTLGFDGYFLGASENEAHPRHFVVRQADLHYAAPILLDETIDVRIDSVDVRAASLTFYQSIIRASEPDKPLSQAKIVIACVQNQPKPATPSTDKTDDETDIKTPKAQQSNNTSPTTSHRHIVPVRLPSELVNTIKQHLS